LAHRAGKFWKVREAVSVFLQMGCELRVLPGKVMIRDGEPLFVRFLIEPASGRFVELIDLHDDESVSLEEIEYWERRLGMEIPKGDDLH
jgi:hypothetical protein